MQLLTHALLVLGTAGVCSVRTTYSLSRGSAVLDRSRLLQKPQSVKHFSMQSTWRPGDPRPKDPSSRKQVASKLIDIGISHFKDNRLEDALQFFDNALELRGKKDPPHLWHRGLSLYYLDRFEDATAQFERDAALFQVAFHDLCGPTEEAIWNAVSVARMTGLAPVHERRSLLPVGKEDRPVFRALYDMFRGRIEPPPSPELLRLGGTDVARQFYIYLYTGLYYEAEGNTARCHEYMLRASQLPYSRVDDAMGSLSRIHLRRRGWLGLEGAYTSS
ncbi:unnamed protein product [Phaeothamnion confervicola]